MDTFIKKLKGIYSQQKGKIESKLSEFRKVWYEGDEERIFLELVFCILTPQSRAQSCWNCAQELYESNLLLNGEEKGISDKLNRVRFKNKKAEYIVRARNLFTNRGKISIRNKIKQLKDEDRREWLVRNVKGMGYKEASHFLRNIGLGENLAILDRHIMKNLMIAAAIGKIPVSLTRKRYLQIEKKMRKFAQKINIPIGHLDFVLWYKETGMIFK
jgi:N-glycosylase/DNA lyase